MKRKKAKKPVRKKRSRKTAKFAKATSVGQRQISPSAGKSGFKFFDPLDLLRRVLIAHDLLFLSRQVTYHIAADAHLPKAWGDVGQVHFVLSKLVEHMIRRSSRNARIAIFMKAASLRRNLGIEISFSCEDSYLSDAGREAFLSGLFEDRGDDVSGISLSDLRQTALRLNGHLWVDFSKSYRPVYHLILPTNEAALTGENLRHETFRYDIVISNYANLRKRFGIKKSLSLVAQIELYVRSLVRYPIDIVMALGKGGIITTIYESPDGSAQTVAGRISSRLGSEMFKIGKRDVDISFKYRLAPISRGGQS